MENEIPRKKSSNTVRVVSWSWTEKQDFMEAVQEANENILCTNQEIRGGEAADWCQRNGYSASDALSVVRYVTDLLGGGYNIRKPWGYIIGTLARKDDPDARSIDTSDKPMPVDPPFVD